MKGAVAFCIGLGVLGLAAAGPAQEPGGHGSPPSEGAAEAPAGGLKLETLLSAELEGVEGTEVIVSRVTIPPNTSLPKHWHPGEEFAYVLEGSATLWLDGESMDGESMDAVTKGAVVRIPLKRVHTAITGDEGATILVFRVHEQGEPERVLVD
jgi:quercetin dioxygenase-like cupin family protein